MIVRLRSVMGKYYVLPLYIDLVDGYREDIFQSSNLPWRQISRRRRSFPENRAGRMLEHVIHTRVDVKIIEIQHTEVSCKLKLQLINNLMSRDGPHEVIFDFMLFIYSIWTFLHGPLT